MVRPQQYATENNKAETPSSEWYTASPLLRLVALISPLKQFEMAHRLNVHRATLGGMLNGTRRVHRDDGRLLELARLLNVPDNQALVPWTPETATAPMTPAILVEAARVLARGTAAA
jgi:hypothetical protein